MNRKGSTLVFVLILSALLAVSVLTLVRRVGISFQSSDEYVTESQAYLLSTNRILPDYKDFLFDRQWITDEQYSLDDFNDFYVDGFRSGERFRVRVTAFDYNSIVPYVWYPLLFDGEMTGAESFVRDSIAFETSSVRQESTAGYRDSFLLPADSGNKPQYYQSRQRINKAGLPSEWSSSIYPSIQQENEEPVLSLGAVSSNDLPFFTLPDEEKGRRIVANTSSVQERLDINQLSLEPGDNVYDSKFFELLKARFPETEDTEIAQYLLNVHDSLGHTEAPTVLNRLTGEILNNHQTIGGSTLENRAHLLLGRSRNPVINEVWTYTPAPANVDGQYFELHNPFEEEFDISGWSVRVFEIADPDVPMPEYEFYGDYRLSVKYLAPGEFFVVTNDYDDRSDEDSNEDSFFDHLGIALDEDEYEEILDMELPENHGRLELLDNEGRLIDYFEYHYMRAANFDGIKSCQRYYPFTLPVFYDMPSAGDSNLTPVPVRPDVTSLLEEKRVERTLPPLGRDFYNLAELLLVPATGYIGEETVQGEGSEYFFSPYPLGESPEYKGLSAGVLDLFYIDWVRDTKNNPLGRVNINSASADVLSMLTGDGHFASQVEHVRKNRQDDQLPFLSFAELFHISIGDDSHTLQTPYISSRQIEEFSKFADFVTFLSDDYWVRIDLKHSLEATEEQDDELPPEEQSVSSEKEDWEADYSFMYRIQRNSD